MFGWKKWPVVALADAPVIAELIDVVLRAETIGPPLRELAVLADLRPDHPERTLWQWFLGWTLESGDLEEHVLAVKMAILTLSWNQMFGDRPEVEMLGLGAPSADERDEIRELALVAAGELPERTIVRRAGQLTAAEAAECLSHDLPFPRQTRFQGDPTLRQVHSLDEGHMRLVERWCANEWLTVVELLGEDELIRAASPVLVSSMRPALLVLTDLRIVVASEPRLGFGASTCGEVHLDHIRTVRYLEGWLRDATGFRDAVQRAYELIVEAETGDFSVCFGVRGTSHGKGARWPNLVLAARDCLRQARQPATVAAAPTGGLGTELEKVVALFREGVLTEAEFRAAKARLLGANP